MMSSKELKVACVVPTFNGRAEVERLLDSLDRQSLAFDLLVVDSSSVDGTLEVLRSRGKNFLSIASENFNHGGTRQMMVDKFPDYHIYIFLTQDAYLEDDCSIGNLISPFSDSSVGAVCGRQLPHHNANPFAQHARFFNYPATSIVKTLDDVPALGIKAPFISNSFSAYRREALIAVGGFPKHVILSEDMYVAAKMLLSGWKVFYSGDAMCRHSHNYSMSEEFRRYFDQGVFHAREPWIRECFGGAGGEGLPYVKSEMAFLGLQRFYLWPLAVVRNALKLLAYKIGQQERYLSPKFKKKLGMYKRYWDSPYAEKY